MAQRPQYGWLGWLREIRMKALFKLNIGAFGYALVYIFVASLEATAIDNERKKLVITEAKIKINFIANKEIENIAKEYAKYAVEFAKNQFNIRLDWSDRSIEQVEEILSKMHTSALKDKPSEENIYKFAQLFGSYIGEVYRRNHKAEWGLVTIDSEELPGLETKKGDIIWPWAKTNNRITNGDEENVLHYYKLIIQKNM